MTGETNSKVEAACFSTATETDPLQLDAVDLGKPLPPYLLKLIKRHKIAQMKLQKRRQRNRKRNKQARKSRRINNILKYGI